MDPGNAFFEQFIDDYFAECEEHLVAIRRVLLALEQRQSLDPEDAQDLARALHTVKGLSGMVGLAPVEALAHAMEDAVGTVDQGERAGADVIELLFAGVALLEDRIKARKEHRDVENVDDYLARVRDVVGMAPASHAGRTEVAAAEKRDLRVSFTPSRELADRGITIDVVRGRLAGIGEISSAAPRVHASGSVYFEFMLRLNAGASPEPAWLADGMSWEIIEAPPQALVPFAGDEHARSSRPATAQSTANMVRVDLTKLDESMRVVGELVISRSRLQDAIDRLAGTAGDAALEPIVAAADAIERQLRVLREGIMRIRLVPIGEVFERMRFAMRDIAREHGKSIQLDFEGGETEIDKVVIDRIVEPLLHLVRNAASHGIEGPAQRQAFGKDATGHIMLRARAAGDRIVVEVEDDGGGINLERVEARAHERGLLPARATLDPSTVLDVIASPGFSTTESADMASGRGVGMAVVVSTIRGLGGELSVDSRPGAGTHFTIELPLTLMIADALLVEIDGETMAVPQVMLREILPLAEYRLTVLENNQVISYRDSVLPLIDLRKVFSVQGKGSGQHVLVVGSDSSLQGLIVDRVVGLREIVVQPVSDPYVSVVGVAGATELADGRVSLILDVPAIVRHYREGGSKARLRPGNNYSNSLGSGR